MIIKQLPYETLVKKHNSLQQEVDALKEGTLYMHEFKIRTFDGASEDMNGAAFLVYGICYSRKEDVSINIYNTFRACVPRFVKKDATTYITPIDWWTDEMYMINFKYLENGAEKILSFPDNSFYAEKTSTTKVS